MNIYAAFALLIIGFYFLFVAAEKFVDLAVIISAYFGLPGIITGTIIVGFATSAPEFAVSILASLQGLSQMGLGNGVGSVICNETLGLGFGLVAIGAGKAANFDKKYLAKVLIFLDAGLLVLYLFMRKDGTLSWQEALFFVVCLGLYFLQVARNSKKAKLEKVCPKKNICFYLFGFLLVLVLVVFLSKLVVFSAVYIADFFCVSKTIIAVTIVALGTSLPEVATAFAASRKGHLDIAVGNIIGSDVLNIFGIVGISALIHPVKISAAELNFVFGWLAFVAIITALTIYKGYKRPFLWGILLISVYLVYLFFA